MRRMEEVSLPAPKSCGCVLTVVQAIQAQPRLQGQVVRPAHRQPRLHWRVGSSQDREPRLLRGPDPRQEPQAHRKLSSCSCVRLND